MGTKNNPGKFDCYANAEPDEPMFILLGRDRHAATLVRIWALLRARDREDEAKVNEAFNCAYQMDAYHRALGKENINAEIEEALLIAATEGLEKHPDGYEHACVCDTCQSYD